MIDDTDDDLTAACLEEFGEGARGREVLFRRPGAADHPMDGIYDENCVSIRVEDGAEISDVSPSLLIRLADLPTGVELGHSHRFVVRGTVRRVWDVRPDGFGMARVLLKDS